MFNDFPIISCYTHEDGVRDGDKVKVGNPDAPIYVNTNVAQYLGAFVDDQLDSEALMLTLRPLLTKFFTSRFHDEGATDYPEECDPSLAIYYIEGTPGTYEGIGFPATKGAREVVWVTLGAGGLSIYFPEDR